MHTYDIFPNPTADILRVISPDRSIISSYAIYDIHSHRITQSQVDHYELELDMQSYATGVYILQLYDRDGAMWSERVVRM